MNRFALILPTLLLAAPAMADDQPKPQAQEQAQPQAQPQARDQSRDELAYTMNAALQDNVRAIGNLGNAARVAMQERSQLQALLMRAIDLCKERCDEMTKPKAAEPAAEAPEAAKPEVAAPPK